MRAWVSYPSDACTVSGVDNPGSPFHGVGLPRFLSGAAYRALLDEAGFRDIAVERVIKTYSN